MSAHRRRGRVVGLVAALLLVPVGHAGADAPYPTAAGTTTIRAEGSAGITLWVPAEATVGRQISAEVQGGSFVWAHFEHQTGGDPGDCGLCVHAGIFDVTEDSSPPVVASCYDWPGNNTGCLVWPGPLTLYIVTDGVATLRIGFEGLGGSTSLDATGRVRAIVERIPLTCPTGDCQQMAKGGIAHEVGVAGAGIQITYGFFEVSYDVPGTPAPNTAVASFDVCVYPGGSSYLTSPDPDDHPDGCDIVPAQDPLNGWGGPLGFGGCLGICGGRGVQNGNLDPHGLVYTGFRLTKVEPGSTARMGAWGMWLEQGIECPSGDFHEC